MAKGTKTGGRGKGTPNKATRDVMERLVQLDCDPIEGMASIAADQNNTPELRGRMFSELAQYVHPKRKAIELGGIESSGGGPLALTITFPEPRNREEAPNE